MRCFIAIDVPDEVKAELTNSQQMLADTESRWTPKETLHITVRFLVEVSPVNLKAVQDTLALVTVPPFQCVLTELNGFPSREHARIIWAGVEKTEALEKLKEQIDRFVEGFVKNEDHAAFIPHITLGRNDFAPDLSKYPIDLPHIQWNVRSFVLKESILTAKGAIHRTVKDYTLR